MCFCITKTTPNGASGGGISWPLRPLEERFTAPPDQRYPPLDQDQRETSPLPLDAHGPRAGECPPHLGTAPGSFGWEPKQSEA